MGYSSAAGGDDSTLSISRNWFATSTGLYRWQDGERLHHYGERAGLRDVRVRVLLETRDGRLLVGTQSGLYEFVDERLVAITPACSAVSPLGASVIGLIAGVLCALAVGLKYKLKYDDSLDVVGVHLVGGLVGSVLAVGLFLHQENRLVDKNKKPLESVWKTIIWDAPKDKSSKKLVDPTPATLAALAQEPLYDGTHVVKVGDTKVTVVTYEGRTREVAETKIKDGDRVGVLPKVIIPMVFSPVVGFVGVLLVLDPLASFAGGFGGAHGVGTLVALTGAINSYVVNKLAHLDHQTFDRLSH